MVQDVDNGMKEITRSLRYLSNNSLRFGWVGSPDPTSKGAGTGGDSKRDDEGRSTEKTVAYIARAHELGLGTLKAVQPPRSALIATIDQKTVEIEEAAFEFIGPVLGGQIIAEAGLRLLGERVADMVKRRYQSQEGWEPLSDKRKAEKVRAGKSGNKARINTGQELNAIRYEIGPF